MAAAGCFYAFERARHRAIASLIYNIRAIFIESAKNSLRGAENSYIMNEACGLKR